MPLKFGTASLNALASCDQRLEGLAYATLSKGFDFSAREGHRGALEQAEHYTAGRSRLRYPDSKHNKMPSLAVHFIPYPVDWDNLYNFVYLAGIVKAVSSDLDLSIRWGGNWDSDHVVIKDQSFNDLAHYELRE